MTGPTLVRHARGTYPVHVGAGALARLPALLAELAPGRRVALLHDATLADPIAAWERGGGAWGAGGAPLDPAVRVALPAGESAKTRAVWAEATDRLLDAGLGRDSVVVAIGGGAAGDLAGFVAATFLRGVPVVQVPTTLLAMVDSAVGGKTGVDTPHGKNLVGAFHPPLAVVADVATLATLPDRDLRAGLAEAVKHGLVADADYLDTLEAAAPRLLAREPDALAWLVEGSVRIKAAVVGADEHEGGERAVLNAGHTVGHAVEHVGGYRLRHGECVALGLVAECRMAESLGLDPAVTARVAHALGRLHLPARLAEPLSLEAVRRAMQGDKKAREGRVRYALVEAVGRPLRMGDAWTTPLPDPVVTRGLLAIGCQP